VTVTAVTDVARVAALARGLERIDCFAFLQLRFRTTMQLHEIDLVRFQPAQAALNAFQD
jgi:hypothetical protein